MPLNEDRFLIQLKKALKKLGSIFPSIFLSSFMYYLHRLNKCSNIRIGSKIRLAIQIRLDAPFTE